MNTDKLTIQDIAPFTDKKLKATKNVNGENEIVTIEGYVKEDGGEYLFYSGENGSMGNYNPEYFKPHLLPISCLTKPLEHNGETFIPIVELAKIAFPDRCWEIDGNGVAKAEYFDDPIQFWYSHMAKGFCNNWKPYTPNQYQLFQKLAEWKINFTLIPEHLYIDADTLENNPYK